MHRAGGRPYVPRLLWDRRVSSGADVQHLGDGFAAYFRLRDRFHSDPV